MGRADFFTIANPTITQFRMSFIATNGGRHIQALARVFAADSSTMPFQPYAAGHHTGREKNRAPGPPGPVLSCH